MHLSNTLQGPLRRDFANPATGLFRSGWMHSQHVPSTGVTQHDLTQQWPGLRRSSPCPSSWSSFICGDLPECSQNLCVVQGLPHLLGESHAFCPTCCYPGVRVLTLFCKTPGRLHPLVLKLPCCLQQLFAGGFPILYRLQKSAWKFVGNQGMAPACHVNNLPLLHLSLLMQREKCLRCFLCKKTIGVQVCE